MNFTSFHSFMKSGDPLQEFAKQIPFHQDNTNSYETPYTDMKSISLYDHADELQQYANLKTQASLLSAPRNERSASTSEYNRPFDLLDSPSLGQNTPKEEYDDYFYPTQAPMYNQPMEQQPYFGNSQQEQQQAGSCLTQDFYNFEQGIKQEAQEECDENDQEEDDCSEAQQEQQDTTSQTEKKTYVWTSAEDKQLLKFYASLNGNWKKIAKKFENLNVTPAFVKSRYYQISNQDLPKRAKFTHKEDMLIAKFFNQYGTQWERMAASFHKRSPVMLKNRYYAHIRKEDSFSKLLSEVTAREAHFDKPVEIMTEQEIEEDIEVSFAKQPQPASKKTKKSAKTTPQQPEPETQVDNYLTSTSQESCVEKQNQSIQAEEVHEEKAEESNEYNRQAMQTEILKKEIEEARNAFELVYTELHALKARLGFSQY